MTQTPPDQCHRRPLSGGRNDTQTHGSNPLKKPIGKDGPEESSPCSEREERSKGSGRSKSNEYLYPSCGEWLVFIWHGFLLDFKSSLSELLPEIHQLFQRLEQKFLSKIYLWLKMSFWFYSSPNGFMGTNPSGSGYQPSISPRSDSNRLPAVPMPKVHSHIP